MDTIKVNKRTNKRMSVKFSFQRLLTLMTAIMMALVTFTACTKDDGNGDGGDNGGGNGGVSGKRIKSYVVSSSSLKMPDDIRAEYSYNNDGTLKRSDFFLNKSTNLISYDIITNNSDGTIAKTETHDLESSTRLVVWEYSYDSNKKPLKGQSSTFMDGKVVTTQTKDYVFQNGKKIREVLKTYVPGVTVVLTDFLYEYEYDSQGRRTATTVTAVLTGKSIKHTRTYNSDGTLQKVTYPIDMDDSTPVVMTFTWENGKSTHNYFDDFSTY